MQNSRVRAILYLINFSIQGKSMATVKNQKQALFSHDLPDGQLAFMHIWKENEFTLHAHSYYEIMIFTKGKALHHLNGHPKVLKPQTMIILKPNEDSHKLTYYKDYTSEHINIAIDGNLFHKLCNSVNQELSHYFQKSTINPIPYVNLKSEDFKYLLHLANNINLLTPYDTNKPTLIIKQMVFNALSIFNDFTNEQEIEYPAWLHDFLEKLNSPDFFLKPTCELYQYAPYSQSKLGLYFKRYVGSTLIEYLTKQKINYACNLLQNTNFSILEISNILSYDSLAHFNRIFKKTTGKSPREYRLSTHFAKFPL